VTTTQQNQARIARDQAFDAVNEDMTELVLEFVDSGLLTAADLRAALDDALLTVACETAAGEQVAAARPEGTPR
jgi:hypothetical protein